MRSASAPLAARVLVMSESSAAAIRRSAHVGARLALLKAFELECDGERVTLALPAQRVVAFLALQDHAVLRVDVAGKLWLDSTQDHAFGSLRSALWSLRQVRPDLVLAARERLALNPKIVVDVADAVDKARQLLDGWTEARHVDFRRVSCLGDLLPGWYDDWVLIERERLRQLAVHALESISDHLVSAGRFLHAMEAAMEAVRCEPLRESAHRSVMRVHLAEGNVVDAMHQYNVFRKALRDAVSQEPSSHMQGLIAGLTTQ